MMKLKEVKMAEMEMKTGKELTTMGMKEIKMAEMNQAKMVARMMKLKEVKMAEMTEVKMVRLKEAKMVEKKLRRILKPRRKRLPTKKTNFRFDECKIPNYLIITACIAYVFT